jgi:hypothetical protein
LVAVVVVLVLALLVVLAAVAGVVLAAAQEPQGKVLPAGLEVVAMRVEAEEVLQRLEVTVVVLLVERVVLE